MTRVLSGRWSDRQETRWNPGSGAPGERQKAELACEPQWWGDSSRQPL